MQATNVVELPTKAPKRRRAPRPRSVFLTPEETLAVLRAAKDRSFRDWAMILLAYRHGLRASEVCGLRLADVNLKDGAITIARLKGSLKTVQPLYAHRGQPLLDETAALRAWLKARPVDGSDYLFTSQKVGRLDRTQFFRVFQAVAEAATLPVEKRHPHVLKHSLASHLIAGNVNLALVKSLNQFHDGLRGDDRRPGGRSGSVRAHGRLLRPAHWRYQDELFR